MQRDVPQCSLLVMRRITGFVSGLTLALAIAWPARTARAATFNVDRTDDVAAAAACDNATADDCSLRGAILSANALSEPSTINVPAGTYVLSESSTCTFRVKTSSPGIFTSSQVPLCLSQSITVHGVGADTTIIDGDHRGRVLFVSADAIVELRGVTLENGNGGPSFFASQGGGGIQNHGSLTLIESIVSGNTLQVSTARGAGIENFGTLSLLKSRVVNNVSLLGSEGGGGIHNDGYYSANALLVSESTISGNRVGSHGGGIFNGATATIINSTISGNTAEKGFGGGVTNLHAGGSFIANVTAIDSTISGNSSGTFGGGLAALGPTTTAHLNNVTVTDNTAGTSAAGSRDGGGVYNSGLAGGFTLQNSIIAGNRDLGLVPAPDCFSEEGNGRPLTSRGYNLIGDTTGCTIVGDTTGNVTGVDPGLGPLRDNGGPTETHVVQAGSAAIDGGNPAAPGSGGAACAALDQRAINRLQDGDGDNIGRCDIGAFELGQSAVAFSATGVRPSSVGVTPAAYVLLYGSGFVPGMIVRLARSNEADIVGDPVTVDPSGAIAATSFALSGQPTGAWDVVITNPDGDSRTLTGGFTIVEERGAEIWSDVVGPSAVRVGRPTRFTVFVGNRGNVDARAVPLRIAVQDGMAITLKFPLTVPPFQSEQVRTDWDQTPLDVPTSDGTTNILLLLPLVPAGFTFTLELSLTGAERAEGRQFLLRAPADAPLFAPDLDPQLVADIVAGARAYAEEAIGISISPDLTPDIERYLRTQLANLVANGRDPLVANLGAQTQVYSRAQLVVDLARFAAVLAGAVPPAPRTEGVSAQGVRRWVAALPEPNRLPPPALPPLGSAANGLYLKVVGLLVPEPAFAAAVLGDGQSEKVGCSANGGALQGCIKGNNEVLGITCCPVGMANPRCCGGGGGNPFRGVRGRDPNDKTGAQGVGSAHFIKGADALRYMIKFENIENATAAAQEVIITDQLDGTKVDLDTFSLGPISFGDRRVTPPPGLSRYSTSIDLRPDVDLIVAIDAGLEQNTGLVTWHFLSIDPLTGQFTEDPLAGFLPPNVNPPEGDGSVVFTIRSKAVDTPVCNQASIVFDVNEAILTPEWCNSIDDTSPSSQVSALASTQAEPSFTVEWSGTDAGADIAVYTIFVSANGGAFTPFLSDTTETSATFAGEPGNTYAFYSIARDLLGNEEVAPLAPDATTRVAGRPCTGDCDGDGNVVVSELVTAVRIALALDPLASCNAADCRNANAVTIDCLVSAVNAALDGCL